MGKKRIGLFFASSLYLLSLLFLTACSEDTVVERIGAARLQPTVVVDPTLILATGQKNVADAPLADELKFTLSADDGKYVHTWASAKDYPVTELLRPGTYQAIAHYGNENDEGFDRPFFYGAQALNLLSGDDVSCEITASLASTVFQTTFSRDVVSAFSSVSAIFHSEEFSYQNVSPSDSKQLFLHPGETEIFLDLTSTDGLQARVRVAKLSNARAQHLYNIELQSDGAQQPTITVAANGNEAGKITITRELLLAAAPQIVTSGFTSGTAVTLPEGADPENPLKFNISGSEAKSLTLTSMAPSITAKGWPSKIDLASATESQLASLEQFGLKISRSESGAISSVDLTEVVSKLRYSQSATGSRFILMAEGENGKCSAPCELAVALKPVTISIASVSNVMIGVNQAEIVLTCRSGNLEGNLIVEAGNDNGSWVACDIEAIEQRGSQDDYAVRFKAPEGNNQQLAVRIIYCGNTLAETTLQRVSPSFTFKADAFALSALLQIECEDKSLIPMITSLAQIYVNGVRAVSVRHLPEKGNIYLGGLQSEQAYTLTATLFDNPKPENFSQAVEIVTENTAQPRNNNFEDHGQSIKYDRLPSGGRYSQSILDIYNQQNFTSFNTTEPSYWASVTPKTFCQSATNPNTWYMAPSSMSEVNNIEGYFAVKLQSVAWDTTGEEIPPYRQKADSYIAYNPNIPNIKHRAAGKLFLGGYRFDPVTLEEHYDEGVDFASRPAAVNGFYHFTPSPADLTDCGRVIVEVMGVVDGKEVTIASNSILLQPALTYTAFSLPLTYDYFGVKATRLKIMLASSRYVGDIDYESSHIKTYSDPVTATSLGGELWVQSLQLSYF